MSEQKRSVDELFMIVRIPFGVTRDEHSAEYVCKRLRDAVGLVQSAMDAICYDSPIRDGGMSLEVVAQD